MSRTLAHSAGPSVLWLVEVAMNRPEVVLAPLLLVLGVVLLLGLGRRGCREPRGSLHIHHCKRAFGVCPGCPREDDRHVRRD